ncbi:phage regulatory CII family protein [Chitinibacter sp. GC72]|uniref:phage regulatory CII family protein n=1 Tax=Chitinibacter sp. GC72 TaxID=1526917 RepID=UPI0012F7DD05|nr:phage regulatory CII family protein [Chitinibacter sp. GC72]
MTTLAMAMYQLVHQFPGGSEALSAAMGKAGVDCGASTLRNKVNPNQATHKLNVIELDTLMAITGDYGVIHALCANHGFVAAAVDRDAPACDLAVLELVTRVWRANGDVGKAVDDTLADGVVQHCEVQKVRSEVYRMQAALNTLLIRLEGMAQ